MNRAGLGRSDLLAEIALLEKERDAYLENLTSTQKRCTELLEELRAAQRRVAELEAPIVEGKRRREEDAEKCDGALKRLWRAGKEAP